ncbi:HAMP domain-containing sensor histidine kinase [Sphaerisporangium sp. NPDC088356]|uniref:sensor histidine kinase n=1 Tax=Sphaerisporangium sp. NPDC088356 TaxID=3154871 RepID=UPI00341D8B1B
MALIVFALMAAGIDTTIRIRTQDHIFRNTQSVATGWAGSVNPGEVPSPAADVDLLQLVDSSGEVVGASRAAAGMPPLSTLRPPANQRIQSGVVCPPAGDCVLFTAVRVPPLSSRLLWGGEQHFVYAGRVEPSILAGHHLELISAAAVLLATILAAWATWWLVGRTLRPVAAIRARTAEISVSDLSLRVPQPPGYDEIAQLARTSNETLSRLEEAVEQQRYFASVVSHELRSPVAGLRIQLEEALSYPGEVEPQKTFQAALTTTQRLQAIIDDVLTLAHLRTAAPPEPEPMDLNALVKEEVAARVHAPPVHADVTGEAMVLGHRIQLIGVLNNLLVNAQRHAASRVDVTARPSGDQAVVTVTDDGDGIAREDRERVFEPFVRLSGGRRLDPGGSGLGLAICRAIVTTHQGTLEIEDSSRGACFVLRLPLNQPERNSTSA